VIQDNGTVSGYITKTIPVIQPVSLLLSIYGFYANFVTENAGSSEV